MQLELTDAEHELLGEILRGALGDLREEIYKTETYDYKEMLKQRESVLTGLIGKLSDR